MPACTACTQSSPFVTGWLPTSCNTNALGATDSANVIYNGPALTCTGIQTGATLQSIIELIDPLLCAASGDYSTYNTGCLAPLNTQKEFVETISAYVCNTTTVLNTFTGTTFPAYQASVTASFNAITSPGITCASAGVVNTDSLTTVLNKYCTKFVSIDSLLDLSGVNWNLCYTVSPTPTTMGQGFNALISQICLLKSLVAAGTGALPVFNNSTSCLSGGGMADSLVTTINLIKTRLCQTGTIDNTLITWGCVTQPSGAQDLQSTLQNIITVVSNNAKLLPTVFSADFVVTNVDNSNLCLGKNIALAVPSATDRKVAATSSDLTPGTLQDKLQAGTNITLDYITTPGKVIINSSGGGGTSGLVLADSTDSTPDYLQNKLVPGAPVSGVGINLGLSLTNPLSHQVSLTSSVDPVVLFTALLGALSTDPGLQSLFCAAVAACPSPCSAPSNVLVTYTAGPASSTTSTSTTTTTTA